ncbi:MAG TPA: Gfo/Idh/MocA family oxidoreductase [Candidatus Acidoferrales bacterium]|jgi:predicted dehydrogenase|nr:Gfo/Idh/MocA family oxidoreductase [Candidatus Acidoferrales bacterium]
MNRRTFAVTAISALSAARVSGANDRIRIGLIGSGGRGREDWGTFLKQPEVEPVAVCDVYDPFREKGIGMTEGRAKGFKDFRKLLDQKDIDSVIVATPDHWHAIITIAACEAGKDVYCEKPLSLAAAEGRKMVEAARQHQRVVQTGSQQRSGSHYAQAVKLIQDGGIGQVHRIDAGMQRNIVPGLKPTEMATGLSPALDWDMWLGPAPKRPFDPFRCIYNFRWFWDYSGGQMTNWGAHHLDIARWICGAEAPTEIAGFGGRYALTDGGETPDVQQVTYQFGKVVVNWTSSEINAARPFTLDIHGTKGTLTLLRGGFQVSPEMLGSGKEKTAAMEALQIKGNDLNIAHARNFLDCVKSRQRPNADVEEGHRSAVMCHLGNISTRLGRSIRWDAAKEQVVGDTEANQMLVRPYRGQWKI